MGRLIEESRVVDILQHTWLNGTIAHRFIDDIKRRIRIEVPTVEAIPRDRVEQLIDMLKARRGEWNPNGDEYERGHWYAYNNCVNLIENILNEENEDATN